MTPAELSYHRNMMAQNSQLFFCLTPSQNSQKVEYNWTRGLWSLFFTITKWIYYLQGAEITVRNDHKPHAKFLNGKNTNNKVNRWGLKLATYNITFKWISGAKNKAADCLSHLVELLSASINMVSVSNNNRPAFNTKSQTQQCLASDQSTAQQHVMPDITTNIRSNTTVFNIR